MSSIKPPRPAYQFILPGIFVAGLFLALFLRIPNHAQHFTLKGSAMGTTWMVHALTPDRALSSSQIQQMITEELELVNQKMSTYISESEVSRFNQSREITPFKLSKQTLFVIQSAHQIAVKSQGAFDITIKPLVNAWGFGVGEGENSPTIEEISLMMPIVGYKKLTLKGTTLQKSHPETTIDLSAIAKGYAVDKVAERLQTAGIENYMVEVGGEIKANGLNHKGGLWRIGIEQPDAEKGVIQEIITLRNQAIATSGDYRNYYERDGKRISHTIDARTGQPITHKLASVSVIHPQAMLADAWATALHVLGPEDGMLLARQENLAVLFLIRQENGAFIRKVSDAFTSQQVKMLPSSSKTAQ